MKDWKLIAEKSKELIEILDRYFVSKNRPSLDELIDSEELKYDIKELESQEEDTEISYPESFLYWLVFEDHLYFPQEENGNNVWYDYERDCYKTLNDVYDVWLNEIKDK